MVNIGVIEVVCPALSFVVLYYLLLISQGILPVDSLEFPHEHRILLSPLGIRAIALRRILPKSSRCRLHRSGNEPSSRKSDPREDPLLSWEC